MTLNNNFLILKHWTQHKLQNIQCKKIQQIFSNCAYPQGNKCMDILQHMFGS